MTFKFSPRIIIMMFNCGYVSYLHIKKLLEFIYTGVTTISANDEDSFTSLLTNLEIGGIKQTVIVAGTTDALETIEEDIVFAEVNKSVNTIEVSKSLKCEVCGQVLKTRTGLRMHLLVHQGSKGKVFTCDVCGKGIVS